VVLGLIFLKYVSDTFEERHPAGLVAILLQGRELKDSTQAQTEQSEALSRQIQQQSL